MAKKKPKMGAPRKPIDFDEMAKLAQMQCNLGEVASFFDVDPETIKRRVKEKYNLTFTDYKALKGAKGLTSLRQMQFAAAKRGNFSMLIHLGKNMLGQSDKHDITTDGKKTIHVRFTENED